MIQNDIRDLITEKTSVWERLKNSNKPIVMYGMGDGAQKIMNVFEQYEIKLDDIFASDEFVRGHSFNGYKVLKLSEVEEKYTDFIVILAFAAFREDLLSKIYHLASKYTVLAPDIPVCGTGLFDYQYVLEHIDDMNEIYNNLADECSKKVFLDVINYKISGKIEYLKSCQTPKEEVYESIIKPTDNEVFVDLGAYNGDTITEFLENVTSYEKIIAFEPDAKNYKKLLKTAEQLGVNTESLYNIGAYSHEEMMYFSTKAGRQSALTKNGGKEIRVNSVDNILNGEKATIIKMDVEGAEQQALLGCKETITKYKPKLMVCAYHKNEDLFALAKQILLLRDDYKIYLRHHPYIPAWETNFYAI